MTPGYCRWCRTYLPDRATTPGQLVHDAHQLACKRYKPSRDVADPEQPMTIRELQEEA